MKQKYPKTFHFSFSPGLTKGDKIIKTLSRLEGSEVVVTLKKDGENTTLRHDCCHARSLDSRHHESRNWLKKFHGEIAYLIPPELRICGENLYAQHSIAYDDLLSYFYGFSVWDNDHNVSLDWDTSVRIFGDLGITPVEVVDRFTFDLKKIQDIAESLDTEKEEGIVVRVVEEFHFSDFDKCVAKWVRKGHVQTDEHWMTQPVIPNKLRG